MKKSISIVIPAYNEEEVIDELVKRITAVIDEEKNYDFEVIIVDNGSKDLTYQKLLNANVKDKRFKALQLSRNFAPDGGYAAGLNYCKGDAAIFMNADLQDPPEMIPEFIKKWEEGYDIVYAKILHRGGESRFRNFFTSFGYSLIYHLTGKLIPKNVTDFRIIDRKVYTIINGMHENSRFIRGMIVWTGFNQTAIEYSKSPRFAGESKYSNPFKLAIYGLNGALAFSSIPLRIVTSAGLLIGFLALFLGFIQLIYWILFQPDVRGFLSLYMTLTILFGALFFFLGIIAEYISRIYEEVKQRPNFIVKNEIGFDKN